ncbi:curli production assembly/transport protein CsgG [Halomonas sp. McH1-25]|uniref:CsgG/HfaB family protein n=1 Tax=unclassified Halomonas TaxID=2609666 RepID=UPI001EF5E783|nr:MULTISPECIES: CsgG/HfaB family protein [unclassified Halomonas]MCG7600479.1 curli production assembly/transport protein CsgG [Halomonas sp. McH1-25]MCP1342922.1 curli production assembly/transport protein CsgG [Halomonas sp. FL8]MCP1359986.1 curli production assembly/transport protein CsgG [Halomonas sp. BBD45]MCP1364707.1 curli production assembly/transport protein CsgG [Halomonas sp. BBD48]
MRFVILILLSAVLSGCAGVVSHSEGLEGTPTTLTPRSGTYKDLIALPPPAGKIYAAVYDFRDMTGQYKPAPASTFSTAVTQGAAAMLMGALVDSGWFTPLERVGLQNLLTERKIIRAESERYGRPDTLPSLRSASVLLEGGIIAYESNIRTGGAGVEYFGIGTSGQYQVDQVTINLRAVEISSGEVLANVTTTKTIYSKEIRAGVYRFIDFKRLLEAEAGVTTNEPTQLATMSAIESAVIHLIARGITTNLWNLKDAEALETSVLNDYLQAPTPML